MTETEDRAARYAEAIFDAEESFESGDWLRALAVARAFMALADAEQAALWERVAELDAEVERLRTERDDMADALKVEVGYSGKHYARAEAAEAEVGQVRAEVERSRAEMLEVVAAVTPCSCSAQRSRAEAAEAERDRLAQTLEGVWRAYRVAAALTVQDVRAQRGDHIAGMVEDSFAAHFDRAAALAAPAADQPTEACHPEHIAHPLVGGRMGNVTPSGHEGKTWEPCAADQPTEGGA